MAASPIIVATIQIDQASVASQGDRRQLAVTSTCQRFHCSTVIDFKSSQQLGLVVNTTQAGKRAGLTVEIGQFSKKTLFFRLFIYYCVRLALSLSHPN